MKKVLTVLILWLALTPCVDALQDFYTFSSGKEQHRFETLTTELRCLVCQNQNLAESNAPLAADLRQQIYHQIQLGSSNQQIIDYLVRRYGDFILYNPPVNGFTLALWIGPGAILISGLLYLFFCIRKKQQD